MNNNVLEEFELYKGKTFSAICKEIVINQNSKKDQLDVLVSELRKMVKTAEDAVIVVPLIRDYIEVGVKNDEQLVKLIGVVQRILSKSAEPDSSDDTNSVKLSNDEISQLMRDVENINTTIKESPEDGVKKLAIEK